MQGTEVLDESVSFDMGMACKKIPVLSPVHMARSSMVGLGERAKPSCGPNVSVGSIHYSFLSAPKIMA